jgi:primary-amine oxidase
VSMWNRNAGVIACSLALGAAAMALSSRAEAAATCADGMAVLVTNVDYRFPTGSRWRFRVDRCAREGLAFTEIRFTPRDGTERLVLWQASVAQIHVPYDTGAPRFRDLTVSTAGLGENALPLSAPECEGGQLYDERRACVQVEGRGYAWKHGGDYALGQQIAVWMSSQLGEYSYINQWIFRDDGTIEPRLGLTGTLQYFAFSDDYLPFGRRINSESEPDPVIGISHLHNAYYRLDFDLGDPSNDAVDRIEYTPWLTASPDSSCAVPGQCGVDVATRIATESTEYIEPERYTRWRVLDLALTNEDGRTVGYDIIPEITGLWSGMTSTTEPWASGELWVSAYNGCERLATDNEPPYIAAACAGASIGTDVASMVSDSAPVNGADLVVWYANRYHHSVRDEDDPTMPIEWTGFHIEPHNFHHRNPMLGAAP